MTSEPDVKLLWLELDDVTTEYRDLVATLAPGEAARAASFRKERDRRRYVIRRAWLRQELSGILRCRPGELDLVTDGWGKPSIAGAPLAFNVSHSRGVALLAISPAGPIGCDLEWRDPTIDVTAFAARFFASEERASLESLPDARRLEGFYCGWTRKEAYVKALGRGLSVPLESFAVELDPTRPARLLRGFPDWSVMSFEPMPGFQAAVVGPGM